jgi:SAM-dependent methyltransferase
MKKTLTQIANAVVSQNGESNGIDKGTIKNSCHGFTKAYDNILTPLREKPILMLEIGVSGGGSLKMWEEYFTDVTIIALDIVDETHLSNNKTFVYQLDQSNETQLQNFVNQCNENGYEFDFIIDDGSHHMRDQQLTLAYLFPLLKPQGIYIIEDLHTSLLPNGYPIYGKLIEIHPNRHNTTLNYLSHGIDSIYITAEQNKYLNENIDYINIHNIFNPIIDTWHESLGVGKPYKGRSITSFIFKK